MGVTNAGGTYMPGARRSRRGGRTTPPFPCPPHQGARLGRAGQVHGGSQALRTARRPLVPLLCPVVGKEVDAPGQPAARQRRRQAWVRMGRRRRQCELAGRRMPSVCLCSTLLRAAPVRVLPPTATARCPCMRSMHLSTVPASPPAALSAAARRACLGTRAAAPRRLALRVGLMGGAWSGSGWSGCGSRPAADGRRRRRPTLQPSLHDI